MPKICDKFLLLITKMKHNFYERSLLKEFIPIISFRNDFNLRVIKSLLLVSK